MLEIFVPLESYAVLMSLFINVGGTACSCECHHDSQFLSHVDDSIHDIHLVQQMFWKISFSLPVIII